MSYIVLRGHWCNIIVFVESEQVFNHFPKYHMKILLGDFNAKLGTDNIFKPIIGNDILSGW